MFPPLVPEIRLHLAHEAVPLWQKTEEELGEMGLAPPFWAFAWAGGQALARYVLDHSNTVENLRVLDWQQAPVGGDCRRAGWFRLDSRNRH